MGPTSQVENSACSQASTTSGASRWVWSSFYLNGSAENGSSKKEKKEAGEMFRVGLLGYRSTPLEDGRSPGERLQEGRLMSTLPDFTSLPGLTVQKRVQTNHSRGPLLQLE